MKWRFLCSILIFVMVPVVAAAETKLIRIKGSDTLGAKMIPLLAELYRLSNPQLHFEIAAEGSSAGFRAIIGEGCEIGMSSRSAKQQEIDVCTQKKLVLTSHVVAYDMIAVVVHADNPVEQLSKRQVEDIFTGKIRSWGKIAKRAPTGEIQVFTRNTASGTYKTFQKLAMRKKDYGKHCQKLAGGCGGPDVAVGKTRQGIGYCGMAYVNRPGVKAVKIDGVTPTPENVTNYALSRSLYLLTTQKTSPEAMSFVRWIVRSPEAAKIISKVGFIAVPKEFHDKSSRQLNPAALNSDAEGKVLAR